MRMLEEASNTAAVVIVLMLSVCLAFTTRSSVQNDLLSMMQSIKHVAMQPMEPCQLSPTDATMTVGREAAAANGFLCSMLTATSGY